MQSFEDPRPPMILHPAWRRVRDVLCPPPPMSISEWADAHRVLGPSSPLPGRWRTDTAPFLKEIQDSLGPHSGVERVVVMKAVQIGLTEALLNVAGYYLAHVAAIVMVVEPNLEVCKRLSRQRVEPLIELCAPLEAIVAKAHGKGGNEMSLKTCRNGGVLAIASAQSAAALRSLPARVVLCDETDAYLKDLGEGNPFDLAAARTTTFGSLRRVAAISTPTEAGLSLVAALFEETDQRRWMMPCPRCAYEQTLVWEGLRWEPGQPETARYRCEGCGHEIAPEDKARMLAAGFWRATKIAPVNVRGYHINALASPWVRWSELVAQWDAAQTSVERKKTFHNLVLALPWQEQAQEIPTSEVLMARAEPYPEGTIPPGGCFLTAGVDVQLDRIEVELVAWGRDYESWSIGYFVLYGDIAEPVVWHRLDEVLSRSWPHVSGLPMQIQAACVDAGFSTSEVTQFTRHRHGRRVFATKGMVQGFGKPIFPRRAGWTKDKHTIYSISSDECKSWVTSRMRIEKPGPGFMHMPISRERTWYEQLVAERLVVVKGQRRWVNPLRQRNEALDCRCLAVAALHSRLLAGVDLNQWCDQFDRLLAPPTNPAPVNGPLPSVVRSRFVWGDTV
jgi:phage terminase large subunit GpA-like protein